MSFECAKQFVSQMKSDKNLREMILQFKQCESMKNFIRDKGFDFNECDLVFAMSSCMEEMAKTNSGSTENTDKKRPGLDENIRNLIAIGAATAANCIPCFEHYYLKANALSLDPRQIREAVDIAEKVKLGAAMAMKDAINELMDGEKEPAAQKCCASASSCC